MLVKRVAVEISKDFVTRDELKIYLQASENLLAAVKAHDSRFAEGAQTMEAMSRRQERVEAVVFPLEEVVHA